MKDTLDEAGGTGFALVARVAGVAQAGVEQRVVAHINVCVGHILGAATSHWHWEDRKKKERESDHNREICTLRSRLAVLNGTQRGQILPRGGNGVSVLPGTGRASSSLQKDSGEMAVHVHRGWRRGKLNFWHVCGHL